MANISKKQHLLKRVGALVLALLVILTTMSTSSMPTVFAAAKKPAIAKTSKVALNGTKALKITKNGYTVTSVKVKSNKSAVAQATATKSKVTVYGIKAGKAKITATVEAQKGEKSKTFKLTSTVKVKNPSAKLSTSSLKVGETASVKVSNAASGAKITYTSSDNSVATVDANGVVTAVGKGTSSIDAKIVLKKTKYAKKVTRTVTAGKVTVTEDSQDSQAGTDTQAGTPAGDSTAQADTGATSTGTSGGGGGSSSSGGSSSGGSSGGSSSSASRRSSSSGTSKGETDAEQTVSTPDALLSVLANKKVTKVTFKTDKEVEVVIPETVDREDLTLVVDAENADITNNGTFKDIEIRAIKADTWTEKGNGNRITLMNSKPVRIIVDTLNTLEELIFKGNGNSAKASKVEVKSGTLSKLNMESKEEVAVEVTGKSTVNAINVSSAASIKVKASGTAVVSQVAISGAGAEVEVTASEGSQVGTVEITKEASGTDENPTTVNVTAEGTAKIDSVITAAENSTTNVTSNENSQVAEVKVTGKASVTIGGDSTNPTTVDITDATGTGTVNVVKTGVTVKTDDSKDADDVINNLSGEALTTEVVDKNGNVTTAGKIQPEWEVKFAKDYSDTASATLNSETSRKGDTVTVTISEIKAGYTVRKVEWSTSGEAIVATGAAVETESSIANSKAYTFVMPELKKADSSVIVTVEFVQSLKAITGLKITGENNVYTASVTTPGNVTYTFYYGDSKVTEFNNEKLAPLSGIAGVTVDKDTVTLDRAFVLKDKYLYVVAKADGYEDAFAGYEEAMEAKALITLTGITITDVDKVIIAGSCSGSAYDSSAGGKFYLTSGSAIEIPVEITLDEKGKIDEEEVDAEDIVSGGAYNLIYKVDKVEKAWSDASAVAKAKDGFVTLKYALKDAEASEDEKTKNVAMTESVEIPEDKTLEIPDGVTLEIAKSMTLTNKGTITNNSSIKGSGTLTLGTSGNVEFGKNCIITSSVALTFDACHENTQTLDWRQDGAAGDDEDFKYKEQYISMGLNLTKTSDGYTISGTKKKIEDYKKQDNNSENYKKLCAGGNYSNGYLCAGLDVTTSTGATKFEAFRGSDGTDYKDWQTGTLKDVESDGATWVYKGVHQIYPVIAEINNQNGDFSKANNKTYNYAFVWTNNSDDVVGISFANVTINITEND